MHMITRDFDECEHDTQRAIEREFVERYRAERCNERILVLDNFMYVTDLVHINVCLSYGRASYSRYITTMRASYIHGIFKFKYCFEKFVSFFLVSVCFCLFSVLSLLLCFGLLSFLFCFGFEYVKCDVDVSWLCVHILFKFWTCITTSHVFFSIFHKS